MNDELDLLRALKPKVDPLPVDLQSRIRNELGDRPGEAHIRLSKPGQTRRRRTSTLVSAALGVLTIALVVGLTLSLSDGGSRHGSSGPVVRPSSGTSVGLSAQAIDSMLVPVTPSDYTNGTRVLLDFDARAQLVAVRSCLADNGFPDALKGDPQPEHGQMAFFEDPATLRVDGFGITKDSFYTSSPNDLPVSSSSAPQDVNSACATSVQQMFAPLRRFENLYYDWYKQISDQERTTALAAAWADWSTCMASQGYIVSNSLELDDLVKGAMREPGAGLSTELSFANPYADCLAKTLVPARNALRTPQQASYIQSHADEMQAAKDQLSAVIDKLSAATGVAYQR